MRSLSKPLQYLSLCVALAFRAGAQPPDVAHQLLALTNADRATHALPPQVSDPALAPSSTLLHQLPGEPDLLHRAASSGAFFTAISENLFRGTDPTPAQIEQTWLSTPVHRANLLDPNLGAAGIALLRTTTGVVVVEDLARTTPAPDLAATEQAVAEALRAAGVPRVRVTPAARALCLQPPAPGVPTQLLTITWDGPQPAQLPQALLHQLATRPSPEAEIAACPGVATAQGFTTARVTALLH